MLVFLLQKAENGDLNWIIPDRFIAFCGPHSRARLESGMWNYGINLILLLKVSVLYFLLKELHQAWPRVNYLSILGHFSTSFWLDFNFLFCFFTVIINLVFNSQSRYCVRSITGETISHYFLYVFYKIWCISLCRLPPTFSRDLYSIF